MKAETAENYIKSLEDKIAECYAKAERKEKTRGRLTTLGIPGVSKAKKYEDELDAFLDRIADGRIKLED